MSFVTARVVLVPGGELDLNPLGGAGKRKSELYLLMTGIKPIIFYCR
jgi:hypothetical protein